MKRIVMTMMVFLLVGPIYLQAGIWTGISLEGEGVQPMAVDANGKLPTIWADIKDN